MVQCCQSTSVHRANLLETEGNVGHGLSAAQARASVFTETSIIEYLGASTREDGESLRSLSAAA